MIVLDYETRSKADLPTVGAYKYANHPSTDILCLYMYDTDTDELYGFDPIETDLPKKWRDKLADADNKIGAVNAVFDRLIHNIVGVWQYGFPYIPLRRWQCISSRLRVNGLPANLEDACIAAKVSNKKNPRGKQLIKLLSIPREDGTFNEDPKLMQEMMEYCKDDVLATVDLVRVTRDMTEQEQQDYIICEEMNERGVKIDVDLAEVATTYASAEQAEISGKIEKLTGGVITKPTQYQRIKEYVLDALDLSDKNDSTLLSLMTVYKGKEKKISLDKDVRESIITAIETQGLNLYEDIEELIYLLHDASASSVAKFTKMIGLAGESDRVRGAFIHAGASQTHRFSSKGLQMHNMRRDCYDQEDAEEIKAKMMCDEPIADVMQTLAKLLRPAIIPEQGNVFVVGDWSAIEARALPWLSKSPKADHKLKQFKQGLDTYIEAAKGIYGKEEIDGTERQVGKVSELSLGYGGAAGAFTAMAKNYGVVLPEHTVKRIVKNWRRANPWAVDFWAKLETAAKNAIKSKGDKVFTAGRVSYMFVPQLLGGTLICQLPDDTLIHYPFARLEFNERGSSIVALKASVKPKSDDKTKHWGEVRLWGGLLAENVTQAICAGLLRDVIAKESFIRNTIVLHVHDEIVLEVGEKRADDIADMLQIEMETPPYWAKGLPLKAEPVILGRYGNH